MTLPLDGILVADLTQNVAGPFCTQILADMGAEVVKIERPGDGDDARAWGPPFWADESTTFMAMNRNKRSLALDLKHEAGLGVLRRLVARADVFIQSLRAGVISSFGLHYAATAQLNPRLVYCSVTAYGTRGPLSELPGYDSLMQAYGGIMSVNGHPGGEPARVGTSIIDMGTGMWAALGIVAAIRQRDATGRGVEVNTALFDTALMWMCYHAMGYLASGQPPQPQGSGTAMIEPYRAFPTADGYAMIAAGSNALFARLTTALGVPELSRDPHFADNRSRVLNRAELVGALSGRTRERKTAELIDALRAAGVPCSPILGIDAVMNEPQTKASGMVIAAPHPRIPDFRCIGLPIEWNGERPPVRSAPPKVGEHSDQVLDELGYSCAERQRLRDQGVVS